MNSNVAFKKLVDLAEVRAGYPFREAITESADGGVPVLRIKDLDSHAPIEWDNIMKTELTGKREPDWLAKGDILFVARGNNNRAYCLGDVPMQVICTPHFFQIHVRPDAPLLPEFLAWQINQKPAQDYFNSSAEGSTHMRNIRRQVLEELQVAVPSMARQEQVLKLHTVLQKEKQLLQKMIENGQRIMDATANDLLANTQ